MVKVEEEAKRLCLRLTQLVGLAADCVALHACSRGVQSSLQVMHMLLVVSAQLEFHMHMKLHKDCLTTCSFLQCFGH